MATIAENTQTDFDNAEAIVMDMLQTQRPGISLRRGTVLRELLVRPMAELYAADARRIDDAMASRSLELMKESGNATTEEVNAILSNFSTSLYKGKNASGYLFIQVAEDSVYSIIKDTIFETNDGLQFKINQSYVATSSDVSGDGYLKIRQSDSGIYYFLIPVEAVTIGSAYEVDAGIRFSISPEFAGFVSATSYAKFTGGLDSQTVGEAIEELESAISLRGMASRTAIKSTLLDKNAGNFAGIIRACSVVGYGDREQIRDKSNVFGVATGGKVDLFVRTYTTPAAITFEKVGEWVSSDKEWVIHLSHDEVPGFYAVKSVSDPDSETQYNVIGSHRVLSPGSYVVNETFSINDNYKKLHVFSSFSPEKSAAYTAFRDVTLHVKNEDAETAGDDAEDKTFLVSVYAYPAVSEIQEYIDRDDVRSLRDDIVVRSAPICFVRVSASVSIPIGHKIPDLFEMREAVASYINSRSFVPRLTASEIVAVLSKFDISRVEMMSNEKHGFRMEGRLFNACGELKTFVGHDIDISAAEDPENLVSKNTVCFAANVEDIEIKIIGDR